MTSTIKVNTITTESGSTLTVGGCGKTVALASGASQTGFGRNGAVNWQTSIKTGDFTSVSGEGYFVDTGSGEIDVTLPSSPSAGDIVAVSDYAKNFNTNNCIMLRNGSNIQGAAANLTLNAEGLAMTFVYADATKGWIVVGAGREADKTAAEFIEATGGTETTVDSDFKVHTFTGPGTFTVTNAGNPAGSSTVDYLVVAGGGGGSGSQPTSSGAGGGGAGGYRESPGTASGSYTVSPLGVSPAAALPISAIAYPITVGGGGAAGQSSCTVPSSTTHGAQGASSVFSTITSTGGGRGGAGDGPDAPPGGPSGQPGGSGGGTANYSGSPGASGGSGNTPPVTPPQGNNGGSNGAAGGDYPTGGGGGATAVGGTGGPPSGGSSGSGGAGATSSINGTPTTRAGGGGGSIYSAPTSQAGAGGSGGGGTGAATGPGSNQNATSGTTNTGGGGGGGTGGPGPVGYKTAGAGGSGIVIIRYKFQ